MQLNPQVYGLTFLWRLFVEAEDLDEFAVGVDKVLLR